MATTVKTMSWSLNNFKATFGNIYLKDLVNSETGEAFVKCKFDGDSNGVTDISIAKNLKAMTVAQLIAIADSLHIIKSAETGNYILCKMDYSAWSTL